MSFRDVEELLAERGIEVDHVTVYRWVQRITPLLADAARFARHAPGDRWFADETYVKVNGVWRYVYRAVDQHGQVIDVLLSARRDAQAARRFLSRALQTLRVIPSEVVTDAAPRLPHDGSPRRSANSLKRSVMSSGSACLLISERNSASSPYLAWHVARQPVRQCRQKRPIILVELDEIGGTAGFDW